jgi:phosphotransferase family enzyme
MMLDIVPLVNRLAPGILRRGQPSVACVCTTRPKYLVFDGDAARPACIVEFGDELRLMQTHQIQSTLRSRMPLGAVAGSLYCAPWRNGLYVHIQEGLAGVPWFRLSDGLTTRAAWEGLLRRAVSVMRRLHEATRDVAAWTAPVDVATELERQAEMCRRNGTPLDDQVFARVREWAAELAAGVGTVPGCWQHGDFSLNNLLVAPDAVAIIDFEEFGGTLVPLHDAFGLSLSVALSQDGRCPLSRAHCLQLCVERSLEDAALRPENLPGLLMHHLLWRINQCHGLDRRARLRRVLIGWARELADSPVAFFADLPSSSVHA